MFHFFVITSGFSGVLSMGDASRGTYAGKSIRGPYDISVSLQCQSAELTGPLTAKKQCYRIIFPGSFALAKECSEAFRRLKNMPPACF